MVIRDIIPLPLIIVIGLQMGWILFDRCVTSQIYHPPPRPYIRPTESSPLSPFYGPDYDTFQGPIKVFPMKVFPCSHRISERTFANPGPSWKHGFLYVMQSHAGGTTISGITSRISRNVAARTYTTIEIGAASTTTIIGRNNTATAIINASSTACATWNAPVRAKRLKNRIKDKSFLWSMVREPVDRMVSRFFHEVVSLAGHDPTTERFQQFVENSASLEYGTSIRTLTMRMLRNRMNPFGGVTLFQQYVGEILDEYDFIGVLERMDESLATLQLLLGLETQDMLYLTSRKSSTSKSGGGGSAGNIVDGAFYTTQTNPKTGKTTCIKLHSKPDGSSLLLPYKEFLHQPYLFEEVFEADVYLYKAINKSLDATIESLGRDKVDHAVKRLMWGQKQVEERCSKTVTFPCSGGEGPPIRSADCIIDDVGCGYRCLDSIGTAMAKDPTFLRI